MIEKILTTIQQYHTIIIHRHVRPDPDAYGSQGGLAEILKASFPEKQIFAVGKEEESLHYLRRLDKVTDEVYKNSLVIVCDTANTARICDERYKLGDKLIKIDHHPNDDPYGDIIWVDTEASSTSEMIYEFYLYGKNKGLKLTDEGARLLYAGIVGDTGRFLFPSTTKKTFLYAGELIHYHFSRSQLYDQMYELKRNVVKLSGYVLQNFSIHSNGVASMMMTKQLLCEFDVNPSEASLLVGTLGNVEGIKAWVFFIEEEDQIRVRIRSKGPIINEVAKKYHGGGHPLAAGASIFSWEEAINVLHDLEKACQSN
ncbi:bifunctional oligoribonuclease/PAP phosphatase NrnA [Bacillus aquiflavi]|uniref:Bifunctional oligoribonuclease/PAP phosphatase NrnA n=1 Tax=Bacillus aquiflavi TaxID=2672567 RepID=A0A6B3W1J3_9BACI|nr:bifunctional oligoribonuclease/PAP phosphatase NrnA [Bacillus aquiflavi]MBA4537117.1 bifunctional oligoribonuclease/PAP phosphatase NrnA [Bacillus aquiflavi]NEY81414.1 bifunctional oligoribonuclease/PAP phosphatase NrnA [Bacillus aquiflavi]UAC47547.1 bifunctional oligoribonuclease/PAP phosphatase NrnA [Bacillus aquiflavi]